MHRLPMALQSLSISWCRYTDEGCTTYQSTIAAIVQRAAVRNHLTVNTLQHNARMESLLSARLKVVVMRAASRCYSLSVPNGNASVQDPSRSSSTYHQE